MMDILEDIISLKQQGLEDQKVVDLLVLKGWKKEQVENRLKVYYLNLHSTEVLPESTEHTSVLWIIITLILFFVAVFLGWLIYIG